MEKKINTIGVVLGLGLIILSLIIGFVFGKSESKKTSKRERVKSSIVKNSIKKLGDNWTFINPLLDCSDIENLSNKTIDETKEKVLSFIEQQKSQGINEAAVYFRDLNNGPWFGINEKDEFLPASLLKVPLMMNVFKQASDDQDFLRKKFIWKGISKNNEYFKAEIELEQDHEYNLEDALGYMIKYSDNNSSYILSYALDTSTLLSSYEELGIPSPDRLGYSISARTYASFFRILYNSTFLNKEYSEKALRLLSETDFNKGLVAGVPPKIKVSHKFGERQPDNITKQLHDCGIIYFPDRPYLLCVMTRSSSSSSFDKLAEFIAQVSKIVYEGVKEE